MTTLPIVGRPWPGQGGVYAGIMRGEGDKPAYHLVVPTDPTSSFDSTFAKWHDLVLGASSMRDGLANTKALLADARQRASEPYPASGRFPAAEHCKTLVIDGHADYYLPAECELRLCFINVQELFPDRRFYMSSSQWSKSFVLGRCFVFGERSYTACRALSPVKAVRRVLVTEPAEVRP